MRKFSRTKRYVIDIVGTNIDFSVNQHFSFPFGPKMTPTDFLEYLMNVMSFARNVTSFKEVTFRANIFSHETLCHSHETLGHMHEVTFRARKSSHIRRGEARLLEQ